MKICAGIIENNEYLRSYQGIRFTFREQVIFVKHLTNNNKEQETNREELRIAVQR